jgi:hypothetical protein
MTTYVLVGGAIGAWAPPARLRMLAGIGFVAIGL